MKISKDYLKTLIKEELENSLGEDFYPYKISDDNEIMDVNENLDQNFNVIDYHNIIRDSEEKIEELKSINEEIKRMKQLVDFRSPLLSKNDL